MSTRHGLEIRAAAAGDAAGLCDLLGKAGYRIDARDMAVRLEAMRHEPGAFLIAVEWGPPSGLVVLHWYSTPQAPQPIAQITSLFVAPDDRRRGLGRLLIKVAGQAARVANCGALELMASPGDESLPLFCASTGFLQNCTNFERPLRKSSKT